MLGSNLDSEEVCFKMKGGREVRSLVGSYLQILESTGKNQGGREVRQIRIQKWCISKSREVGRFIRSLVHIFNFWRVHEKTQGGKEVRFESGFRRSVSQNEGR